MVHLIPKPLQKVLRKDAGVRSTPGSATTEANPAGRHDHGSGAAELHDTGDETLERNVLGAVRSIAVDFAVQRSGRPDLSDVDVNITSARRKVPRAAITGDSTDCTVASVDSNAAFRVSFSRWVAIVSTLLSLGNGRHGNLIFKSVAIGTVLIGVTVAALIPFLISPRPSHPMTESRWQPKVVRHLPPLPLANPSRPALSAASRTSN